MNTQRPFKWRHFQSDIILLCLRWYLRYALSYRNLEEMMQERGLTVDHTTIYRWVQSHVGFGTSFCNTTAVMTLSSSILCKIATSNSVLDDQSRTRQYDDVFQESLIALVAPDTGITLRLIKDCEERRCL